MCACGQAGGRAGVGVGGWAGLRVCTTSLGGCVRHRSGTCSVVHTFEKAFIQLNVYCTCGILLALVVDIFFKHSYLRFS